MRQIRGGSGGSAPPASHPPAQPSFLARAGVTEWFLPNGVPEEPQTETILRRLAGLDFAFLPFFICAHLRSSVANFLLGISVLKISLAAKLSSAAAREFLYSPWLP
jgi:hypothetical protein